MKKVRILLVVMMLSSMIITPALSGISSTYAFVADDEGAEDAEDITIAEGAAIVGAATGLIKSLLCPNTPQNRCKNGVCKSGACISFRSVCNTLGEAC